MAAELRAVHDDDVIGELAVVCDVRVRHDEAVVADAGDAAALRRAEIDAHELADAVVRADRERRIGAGLVAQVLRRSAEHGAVLNVIVRADRDSPVTAADPRMRLDHRLARRSRPRLRSRRTGRSRRPPRSWRGSLTIAVGWMLNVAIPRPLAQPLAAWFSALAGVDAADEVA